MSAMAVINGTIVLIRSGSGAVGAVLQTIVTKGFVQLLTVGTGLVTARALGPEGRGLLAALIMWPQFLAYLSTFGLPNSVIYNLKARPSDAGNIVASACLLMGGAGAAAAAIGAALLPLLLTGVSPGDLSFARFVLIVAPIGSIGLVIQAAAEARGDFSGSNAVRMVPVISTFLAICALAAAGALTPRTAALAYALPGVPVTGWLVIRVMRRVPAVSSDLISVGRRLFRYGLSCYPIDLFGTLAGYIGQAFVVARLPSEAVGLFTVSFSVSQLVDILYAPISAVLLPTVAAGSKASAVEKTALAARLSPIIALCAVVPLLIIAPEALSFVYGPSFAEAAPIARLLLIRAVLSGMALMAAQAFLALGRPRVPMMLHLIRFVLSVPILLLLMPRWGAVGAAAGLCAVSAAGCAFVLACHRILLGTPLSSFVAKPSDFATVATLFLRRIR